MACVRKERGGERDVLASPFAVTICGGGGGDGGDNGSDSGGTGNKASRGQQVSTQLVGSEVYITIPLRQCHVTKLVIYEHVHNSTTHHCIEKSGTAVISK